MPVAKSIDLVIPSWLIEAIEDFPAIRKVEHCGQEFKVSSLSIYGECPLCGKKIKLRSYGAGIEVEDLFDAFLAWMNTHGETASERMAEIASDTDDN